MNVIQIVVLILLFCLVFGAAWKLGFSDQYLDWENRVILKFNRPISRPKGWPYSPGNEIVTARIMKVLIAMVFIGWVVFALVFYNSMLSRNCTGILWKTIVFYSVCNFVSLIIAYFASKWGAKYCDKQLKTLCNGLDLHDLLSDGMKNVACFGLRFLLLYEILLFYVILYHKNLLKFD